MRARMDYQPAIAVDNFIEIISLSRCLIVLSRFTSPTKRNTLKFRWNLPIRACRTVRSAISLELSTHEIDRNEIYFQPRQHDTWSSNTVLHRHWTWKMNRSLEKGNFACASPFAVFNVQCQYKQTTRNAFYVTAWKWCTWHRQISVWMQRKNNIFIVKSEGERAKMWQTLKKLHVITRCVLIFSTDIFFSRTGILCSWLSSILFLGWFADDNKANDAKNRSPSSQLKILRSWLASDAICSRRYWISHG